MVPRARSGTGVTIIASAAAAGVSVASLKHLLREPPASPVRWRVLHAAPTTKLGELQPACLPLLACRCLLAAASLPLSRAGAALARAVITPSAAGSSSSGSSSGGSIGKNNNNIHAAGSRSGARELAYWLACLPLSRAGRSNNKNNNNNNNNNIHAAGSRSGARELRGGG